MAYRFTDTLDITSLRAVQKSSSSKTAAIFSRRAYFQYVSKEKWRERRWWLFSIAPFCKGITPQFSKRTAMACAVGDASVATVANFDQTRPNNLVGLPSVRRTRLLLKTAWFSREAGTSLIFGAMSQRILLLSESFLKERVVQIGNGLPLGG